MLVLIYFFNCSRYFYMSTIHDAISLIGSHTKLARAVGVSVQSVCFWRDGKRSIAPDKCVAIEVATGGLVTRQDLRPDDWWKIWPELADADAANLSRPVPEVEADGDYALREGAEFLALKRRRGRMARPRASGKAINKRRD